MKITIKNNDCEKNTYITDVNVMQVFRRKYPSEEEKFGLYYWLKVHENADDSNFCSAMIVHCPDYIKIGAIVPFPKDEPIVPVESELIIHGGKEE
jgi:hypothetical protein